MANWGARRGGAVGAAALNAGAAGVAILSGTGVGDAEDAVASAKAGRWGAAIASGFAASPGGKGLKVAKVVEGILSQAKKVSTGRTAKNAGDFVNIWFKDGSILNVRVENHPPLGRHGNVEYWDENGVRKIYRHIDKENR